MVRLLTVLHFSVERHKRGAPECVRFGVSPIMRGGPCQFWYCAWTQHADLVMWTPLKKALHLIRFPAPDPKEREEGSVSFERARHPTTQLPHRGNFGVGNNYTVPIT
jgi:hypothetical protein